MTDAPGSMNFLEEEKRAIEVLKEANNSDFYRYDADVYKLKELHKAGAGGELP